MTNLEKYVTVFAESFQIEADEVPGLEYQAIGAWDSVGHMVMIAALEEAFDVVIDTDDIIDFSSFEKGKSILQKYDVDV